MWLTTHERLVLHVILWVSQSFQKTGCHSLTRLKVILISTKEKLTYLRWHMAVCESPAHMTHISPAKFKPLPRQKRSTFLIFFVITWHCPLSRLSARLTGPLRNSWPVCCYASPQKYTMEPQLHCSFLRSCLLSRCHTLARNLSRRYVCATFIRLIWKQNITGNTKL